VYIDGNLFRIAGQDADAIGKTVAKPPDVRPAPRRMTSATSSGRKLKTCYDPEIPIQSSSDLGLVYQCDVSKNGTPRAPWTYR